MNWEMFKSLLLTVLVALSLLLTWNLWNFHSDFQPMEDTNYVASEVSEDGKASLTDVVHPLQAIFHKDGKNLGLNGTKQLKQMFTGATEAKYTRIRQLENRSGRAKFPHQLKKNSIELIFPHAISVSLFSDMLKKPDDDTEDRSGFATLDQDLMFDRIAFYKAPSESANMKVLFKEGNTSVASADVKGLAYADLNHYKNKGKGTFVSKDLANGSIYLPANEVDVKKIFYYTYQWIDVSKFKSALFRDPHDVLRKGDYFTNGANSLKEQEHIIKYVNPGSSSGPQDSPEGADGSSIVRNSFDYINGHSGWTDPYVLFDYNRPTITDGKPGRGAVTFRLMIGDDQSYPVFSRVFGNYPYRDAGTILLYWQDGSVHDYARTLLDMPSSFDKGAVRHLSSGVTLLQKLKNNKDVRKGQIRDLRIGYEMVYPPNPNSLVFTPKWYVLYGGEDNAHWEEADELLDVDQEGNKSKEEVTK